MNETDKLYTNAGVTPRRKCEFYEDCPYGFGHSCDNCDIEYRESNSSYPPFTAEKQLEIIKLISKQGKVIIENWETDNIGFNVVFRANSNLRYITFDSITRQMFEEALAQVVNDIWQDLTPEEKTNIKNILEI